MTSRRGRAFLLVAATLVAAMLMVAALYFSPGQDLAVLRGKEPDLSMTLEGGVRRITYRFEGDFEGVADKVETQIGVPYERYAELALWERPGESVSVGMGKLALSQEEYEGQVQRRQASGLKGVEWLKFEGGDKWVTIQIDRKPGFLTNLWFRLLAFFRR